ncbi:Oidioi.mRNA.OKI2018_I69.XSR.g13315.t1.cds [Oikopleura dioica]|uniref:Oidioi.mRNA.OKI2018_I69.XSR.g13315.t1.cds n=1 Tax=Oikopleura dioica TaxID=34765 RepID=A0ABN7SA91_OIKDI|nr:Oidioi.mRNA.OKI2018_I69.XSR.g13315.t1.cds [Oikopleura dioica]
MESVELDNWSLIWDRTNEWIQLRGIQGEYEIETTPVESAHGSHIIRTGNTEYTLGDPSKNAEDWLVPDDIRRRFIKEGFPKEWVAIIVGLQERRVTRHTPKRETGRRQQREELDTRRIGLSAIERERAHKLEKIRALQKMDSHDGRSPLVNIPKPRKRVAKKVPVKKAAPKKTSAVKSVEKKKKKPTTKKNDSPEADAKEEEKENTETTPVPKKTRGRKTSVKKVVAAPKPKSSSRAKSAGAKKRTRKNSSNEEKIAAEKEGRENAPSPAKKARKPRSKSAPAKKNARKKDVGSKKTPKKTAKEKEKESTDPLLSPDRPAGQMTAALRLEGLPTPTFKTNEKKKAKAKAPTQKEKRERLQRLNELNKVEKQVITPVRKPKDFVPECESDERFGSPQVGGKENHDPFSTPAANRGNPNRGFQTPAMGAFATPGASSSAGSPSGFRFQTPGDVDLNTSKKFTRTPTANISKKQAADRVRNAEFIRKEMERKGLEEDLFDVKKGKKRRGLSKKDRVEMSALLPVEEAGPDEDETDEYF